MSAAPTQPRLASVWLLFLPVLLLGMALAWSERGRLLDYWMLDAYWNWQHESGKQTSVDDPLIIGIDEKFLEKIEEPIALTHRHLARVLYGLGQVGPRAVGIDMVLPEKRFDTLMSTRTEGMDYHRTLLTALMSPDTAFPLMIAKTWDHERSQFRDIMPDYMVALSMREYPSGFVSSLFCADVDGIIRHLPGTGCQPGNTIGLAESVFRSTATAETALSGLINFGEGPAWSYLPIQDVLAWLDQGDIERLRQVAAGRMVIIGTTFSDTDLLKAPVRLLSWPSTQSAIPGMIIHAQILRTLANDSMIKEMPRQQSAVLVLLATLAWFGESNRRKSLSVLCIALLLPVAGGYLLSQHRYWFPFIAPAFMLLATASLRGMYDGLRYYLTNQRLKTTFGGYVSPAVLAQITSGKITADRGGVSAQLCVLFSDIRGFTTLSEHYPPAQIVDILNRYFDRMTALVHKHEGTVDKFIGDGLMAFFGAPNPLPMAERQAVAAAQEMLSDLREFNTEMVSLGYPALAIGIGLHTGEAIVGNVGARQRNAYTAIGDTVNTASRLEGLCKTVGYALVCSEAVYQALSRPDGWVALGDQPLKGRAAMAVYAWEPSRMVVPQAASAPG